MLRLMILPGLGIFLVAVYAATAPAPDGGAATESLKPSAGTGDLAGEPVPPADHHMHAWTAEARAALAAVTSDTVAAPEPAADYDTLDADNVIAVLDSAGVRYGVLLSVAYGYGAPDVRVAGEYRKVKEENDWVARQASAYPERLAAFFSVNPLAEYAVRETRRCATTRHCVGVKLHLANSDIDLRNPDEVAHLRDLFGIANELGLAVTIHLQTRREEYGAREVDAFIDHVLPAAPDIPVQVAHLGGNSLYDEATRRAVKAVTAALEDHPERMRNVFLDLAAVPVPEYLVSDGDSASLADVRTMNRRLAEGVQDIGLDRIVYATDWPVVSLPDYLAGTRRDLPLDRAKLRELIAGTAPYLR